MIAALFVVPVGPLVVVAVVVVAIALGRDPQRSRRFRR